jgi:hypothetical protein
MTTESPSEVPEGRTIALRVQANPIPEVKERRPSFPARAAIIPDPARRSTGHRVLAVGTGRRVVSIDRQVA